MYTTEERHDLLDALADKYEGNDVYQKVIASHYDEERFDEEDYEELVGILQLFSPDE